MNPLSRGILEMLGVSSAFLALGLVSQGVAAEGRGVGGTSPAYASAVAAEDDSAGRSTGTSTLWLVDGYNVLCSGLLGGRERNRWWSEERREELLRTLERFEDTDAEIWVVFDGEQDPRSEQADSDRVRIVFAPSADAWLVGEVKRRADEDRQIHVVTADRQVAGRSQHRGAHVVSPRELLGRCMS